MEPIQITVPSKNDKQTEKDIAIGIDFGTTHSVIAFSQDKKVEILTDQENNRLIPSIVAIKNSETIVGHKAKATIKHKDVTIIPSIKRLIGKGIEDLTEEYNHFYSIIDRANSSKNSIAISVSKNKHLSPTAISSQILNFLKEAGQKKLQQNIKKTVITVPAHFNEHQRNAIKHAANKAGLETLRILNEPTAAAVAYGLNQEKEGNYIIYDFGGGTFDVSILQMTKGVFKVLATSGDTNLGGDDIDYLIAKHITKLLKNKNVDEQNLLKKSRELKEKLSKQDNVSTNINNEIIKITKNELNKVIEKTINKTINITLDALDDSNIDDDIDGIILVGGSSRIPLIKKQLQAKLNNIKIYNNINPDEVVAYGAALQAESLAHGVSSHLLLDVNPLSLGIELADGINERIIERNTTVPVSVTKQYTTYKDSQDGMILTIIQGERELAKDCRKLGTLELKGIPPMKAGSARISITFTLDADNLLTVKAEEQTTGTKQQIEILSSYKLNTDAIENMLYDSIEHAQDDITNKALIKTRFKAQAVIEQALESIKEDEELLSTTEKQRITDQCNTINKAMKSKKTEKIEKAIKDLEKAMTKFNSKKINKYINIGLKGANINTLKNT